MHKERESEENTHKEYLSIIQNSCCAKNELTLPVLSVTLNIDFLTKYYNIIVLLSKVVRRGRAVAHTYSCCDSTCLILHINIAVY